MNRLFQWVAVLVLVPPVPAPAAQAEVTRPNVVLIMTDDQGWGDVGCHGNEIIQTPHLDRLAGRGVRFDRFYVSPVCAPTRASLLTGGYDVRTGVSGVTGRREVMRASELTIAELLRGAGYRTACFGKWHNGEQYPNHPRGQGFDRFFGFCAGHWNNYFDSTLEDNGVAVETMGYITDVITDAAIDFLRQPADRPFFCYVPYNAPHTPWQVPDDWFDRYADTELSVATRSAYAMVSNIDHNVGRILKTLEERNLSESTIVVFLTDNGPNGDRYNGGMRGRKGSVHEGGVRVPLFVCWPGKLKPRTVTRIAAHIDLLPTLAELCGVEVPHARRLDGRSLVPLLRSASAEENWTDRGIFTMRPTRNGQVRGAVRTQRYRFVRERTDQLYDMQADPAQKRDISRKQPDVFNKLRDELDRFTASVRGDIAEPEPIPVGHPGFATVELPGVEARLPDGVVYHNGNGWAHDWISDFDRPGEAVVWPIQVENAGLFDVWVDYACGPKAVGTSLVLRCDKARVEFRIEEPFDSPIPLRPERVAPKGGLRPMRTFRAEKVGSLNLAAGRYELVLKHNGPGPARIDIGGLRLRMRE